MGLGAGSGRRRIAVLGLLCAIGSASCTHLAAAENSAAQKPLPPETLTALGRKVIPASSPVYIRIFKQESELEVWKARADGRYLHVKTFPICTWSGSLGPKLTLGDRMSPEGFYAITPDRLKPDSKYHLALNVGYPNALDRALKRTGDFIMVHGQCVSVGCFAMTNDLIEEIYAFVRVAFEDGVDEVPVHIFPFRMTATNMTAHASHAARDSWQPLKEAYDDFAKTHEPPRVGLCGKRYVVNPLAQLNDDPLAACPARIGKLLAPVSPRKAKKLAAANTPLVAEGLKTRDADGTVSWSPAYMLGASPASPNPETADKKPASNDAGLGAMTPLRAE
jgi:murein L,D-transpeptidase YafK